MTEKRLNHYRDILREIEQLETQIDRENDKAEQVVKDSVSSAATFPYSKHTVVVEGIDTIAREKGRRLNKKRVEALERANAEREALEDYINSVPDSRVRVIMRYRYIDGLTWQRIATKMGWTDESTPRQKIQVFLRSPENPDCHAV